MKKNIIVVILAGLLMSPYVLSKKAPSYSFFNMGYTVYSDTDISTEGLKLKGAISVSDYIFIVADYTDTSGDINGFDVDLKTQGFGAGVNYDLRNGGSWYASYVLNKWKIENSEEDFDTTRLGYRHNISKRLELNASITSSDGDGDGRVSGNQLGLIYNVSEKLKVSTEYELLDSIISVSLGFHFNF